MSRALLLSGGIDSIALLFWLRPEVAITIDYGQIPAQAEIDASAAACVATHTPHEVLKVDSRAIGGGSMLSGAEAVHGRLTTQPEWWPFRNQLLLTIASAHAVMVGISHLAIGSVSTDASHRDGTPAFIEAIDHLVSIQEGGLRVEAPAIGLTSTDLVSRSGVPRQLLSWAHSCHVSNHTCGRCRGCTKYQEVMDALD